MGDNEANILQSLSIRNAVTAIQMSVAASSSTSRFYAYHIHRHLNRTLEVRKICCDLLKCQAAFPILAIFFLHVQLELLSGHNVDTYVNLVKAGIGAHLES